MAPKHFSPRSFWFESVQHLPLLCNSTGFWNHEAEVSFRSVKNPYIMQTLLFMFPDSLPFYFSQKWESVF